MVDRLRWAAVLSAVIAFVGCTARPSVASPPTADGASGTASSNGSAPSKSAAVDESWYAITFHGGKVGYVRARDREVTRDGKPAVHVDRWSVITVRRREETIRMEHQLDAWFRPDGTPLGYTIVRREGGEVRKGEGTRQGERFVMSHSVGGRTQRRTLKLRPSDRLAASLEWLHLRDPEPGLEVSGRAIDETEGDVQPFTLTVGEPIEGSGGAFSAKEVLGGVESALMVAPGRGLVRSELVGVGIVMERTTAEAAMRLDEAVDVFSAALFPVKVDLPKRTELDRLTAVFTSERRGGPPVKSFPRQSVKALDERRVEVTLVAPPVPDGGEKLPIEDPTLARWLAATDYEDLSDPRLVAAARREVGDATDAWTAARRLNRFVHRHLESKTLAHAFASATEALTEKAGDCTEHAVLFSALAKIVGIPTKLVTGLVYVGGTRPAFGYHEWVEVWLGDRWHPMDPTFGQDVADATHIKFSEGLSDPKGLRDAGLAAAGLIGDVEVEVTGWIANGRRGRP